MILKLGSLDVSDYVEVGFMVDNEPVYDDTTAFTNMLGQEMKKLIGRKIHLSVSLGEIPDSIASQICSICETDTLTATYATPNAYTATFKRPRYTCELTQEIPEKMWDISLSMSTDIIPIDGL